MQTSSSSAAHPPSLSQQPGHLTVVVPSFNEAECIPALVSSLEEALTTVADLSYDLLFIDDGSSDATPQILSELARTNPHVGSLRFVRNFGHQAALIAGLEHATGDVVVVMDADLQHPPELVPRMIEQWRSGYDVVQAIRLGQPGWRKSLASRAFYKLLNMISEVELVDGAADFRLMSRAAVKALLAMPEQSRFIRGLIAWLGFPCAQITFHAPERRAGTSQYTFRKMLNMAVEAVVSLSTGPLLFGLYVAGIALLFALAYAGFIAYEFASGHSVVRGWPSTLLTVLGMGSANLVCTGIIGLYLRSIMTEIRRRPKYLISAYTPAGGVQNQAATRAAGQRAG